MASLRRRLRSLRASAVLMVLAVLVSPLAFLVVQNGVESVFGRRTVNRAIATSDEVAEILASASASGAGATTSSVNEAIDDAARARDQRVRVLRADTGEVVGDFDYIVGHGALYDVGDLVYGPERVDVLRAWDTNRPPLAERPEVVDALTRDTLGGAFHAYGCDVSLPGNLFVCHAAKRVTLPGGVAGVVHVEGSSRRALQPIYEGRRLLLKLVAFTLALGLALAYWLARRMVKPVERLRDEVLVRARAAVPRGDVAVERDDEIGDLADAFNTLMTALAERSRANEAFLADLAHEFKNPVASVRACADRLAEEGAIDEARKQRLAEVLRKSSARLDALVTQFLELARAESGFPNEERETVDVEALVRGLVTAARENEDADGRAPHVEVSIASPADEGADAGADGGAMKVRGVAHRLESALRNLLDNAVSFAGADGRVEVSARADGRDVEIVVADSGPGIAKEDLPRVFDRFFTKREGATGSGLGLAMTRAAIEAHGGSVHAESDPAHDRGARFVVRLPRSTMAG